MGGLTHGRYSAPSSKVTFPYPAPFYEASGLVENPFGSLLMPQGRVVAYVHSGGAQSSYPDYINDLIKTTLAEALPLVGDEGDTIRCMAGHAEDVVDDTMLDDLVAGTNIVGVPHPSQSDAPTFTWTAVGSQWGLVVADVNISGLRFEMNGADNITAAMATTPAATGARFLGNYFQCGTGVANDAAIPLNLDGDDPTVANNAFVSDAGAVSSVGINLGSSPPVGVRILNNRFDLETSADTVGIIQVGNACLSLLIAGNSLNQRRATGAAAIRFADVVSSGVCAYNTIGLQADGVASATGISIAGVANLLVRFFENYNSDEVGRSGVLTPVVAT